MRFLIIAILFANICYGQTLGGNSAFNFLKLSSSPVTTAAGGINISYNVNDVSVAAGNPGLLAGTMSSQVNASFNAFLGGIKTYSLTGAHHANKMNTTFAGHVYFVDYGSIPATDAAGNMNGDFRPVDYVVQASMSRSYLEKWRYGATLKFINSSYGQFRSNAIAVDFGLLYFDSAKKFTASLVAKNMGAQLKTYTGEAEDLPFDLQVGITKRLDKAPFGFSFTAHQLHRFNLGYNDTLFNNENGFASSSGLNKLFNHFVAATHIYIGQNLEAIIGYNHLRRQELSTANASNGLAGFSAGVRMQFSKLQILYGRSTYQKGVSYNQIGITAQLNKLVGLGK